MRVVLFLTVICVSLFAIPQQANRAAVPQGEANARHLTVRGCIRGDKRYTFSQEGTGATFRLEGKARELAKNRGKSVELLVRELPPTAGSSRDALPILEVERLKQIAAECPATGSMPASKSDSGLGSGSDRDTAAPRPMPPGASTRPNTSGESGAPSAGTGNTPPH
jgi:hypothetical protein